MRRQPDYGADPTLQGERIYPNNQGGELVNPCSARTGLFSYPLVDTFPPTERVAKILEGIRHRRWGNQECGLSPQRTTGPVARTRAIRQWIHDGDISGSSR